MGNSEIRNLCSLVDLAKVNLDTFNPGHRSNLSPFNRIFYTDSIILCFIT